MTEQSKTIKKLIDELHEADAAYEAIWAAGATEVGDDEAWATDVDKAWNVRAAAKKAYDRGYHAARKGSAS